MRTLCFIDLPTELICRIMADIDVRDLYRCTLTCRFLRQVVENSLELQYGMQLGINWLVCDIPITSEPSLPTRLELLRQRQSAWRYLQWKEEFVVEPHPHDSKVYEYLDGVYSHGNGFGLLSFCSFRVRSEQDKAVSWTHSVDLEVVDYTSDSTQDLLIFIAASPPGSDFVFTSYVRSMSTNEMHPRATAPNHQSLPFQHVDVHFVPHYTTIQVAGDFVALLVKQVQSDRRSHVELWNWTQAASYGCELLETMAIDDIHFLSLTTLLVTSGGGFFVEIYSFDDPAVSDRGLISIGKFGLPKLVAERCCCSMHASSYPLAGNSHVQCSSQDSEPLFKSSSEGKLCTLSILLHGDLRPFQVLGLVVHTRVFLGLDPHVCEFLKKDQSSLIPWEVWGPQNSRWFPNDWIGHPYAICGLRVVDACNATSRVVSRGKRLRLRDFNPYAVPFPITADDTSLGNWRKISFIKEPLRIPAGTTFAEDVESHLPYREVITEENFDVTDVMMDDERIILRKRRDVPGDKLTVLRF